MSKICPKNRCNFLLLHHKAHDNKQLKNVQTKFEKI